MKILEAKAELPGRRQIWYAFLLGGMWPALFIAGDNIARPPIKVLALSEFYSLIRAVLEKGQS